MSKRYYSLGLMSGTSLDGVDASIIVSDGEKELEIIDNCYNKYENNFKLELKKFINNATTLEYIKNNKILYSKLEKQLTLNHAEVSKRIIEKNKNVNVDFLGFHGQTILHQPMKNFSIQMGDPNLLSYLLKKKVYFNFRKNDILNGGDGAPLSPIYHYQILKRYKLPLPVIFLNIGGIANITHININEEMSSFDLGPGNCLIDKWIYQNIKKDFDNCGLIAKAGKVDYKILDNAIKKCSYLNLKQRSFDIKEFDISFVKELSLEDGAATLTNFTAHIISEKIKKINDSKILLILCGGGRKNEFLIKNILKHIKYKLIDIDTLGLDGDYIESQAFAYLAIRSRLNKNISFPNTTGVKISISGGEVFKNY